MEIYTGILVVILLAIVLLIIFLVIYDLREYSPSSKSIKS